MASPPPKQTMKERILETADKLFYLQGIRAIGVDTISAEIGISKRTLYNHFPSKDALIAAYLQRRFVEPRPSDKPPAEQILATFDSLERRFSSKDYRGCPFVNAVAELGPEDEDRSVRNIAVAFKESRRVWFRDLLQQLGVADVEGLATQRSEEHTSELQSRQYLVCRLLLEKKKKKIIMIKNNKKKIKK